MNSTGIIGSPAPGDARRQIASGTTLSQEQATNTSHSALLELAEIPNVYPEVIVNNGIPLGFRLPKVRPPRVARSESLSEQQATVERFRRKIFGTPTAADLEYLEKAIAGEDSWLSIEAWIARHSWVQGFAYVACSDGKPKSLRDCARELNLHRGRVSRVIRDMREMRRLADHPKCLIPLRRPHNLMSEAQRAEDFRRAVTAELLSKEQATEPSTEPTTGAAGQ